MCKNTGQFGLTQPFKDQVRVIGCATHLERSVFLPEPTWVEPEPD